MSSRDRDLPAGIHHIRDIVPGVLADISRRTVKTALVEGACRGELPEEFVQGAFNRFRGLKGV